MAVFEVQRKDIEANNLVAKSEAEALVAKMTNISVILIRQAGESGQLFGSVSSRDIADALDATGYKVGKNQIILNRALKTLGLYDITVRLHAEVDVSIVVNVARSAEEAEIQAAGGDIDAEAASEEFAVEDFLENEEDADTALNPVAKEEDAPVVIDTPPDEDEVQK